MMSRATARIDADAASLAAVVAAPVANLEDGVDLEADLEDLMRMFDDRAPAGDEGDGCVARHPTEVEAHLSGRTMPG